MTGIGHLPNWRWGMLLLALLLAALTTGGTLHAREYSGDVQLECSGHADVANADDRSGSDDGQPIQHHATCHTAAAFLPEAERAPITVVIAKLANRPRNSTFRGLPRIAPDLRPPIA